MVGTVNGAVLDRLSVVANGASISDVYGGEWCLNGPASFRADLCAMLAAAPKAEPVRAAGEAYQIIGSLADAAGVFNTPEVQAALDYFSGDCSGEILPWSAPKVEQGLQWYRLGDVLPEQRAILIASKKEGEDFWRVRDAVMQVRYEGVLPHVSDLANGNRPVTWWFDSIYPGKGDCRLAHEDLLWTYIPTPDDHPAPASDELLEALAPFANAAKIRLCGEWRDDERFWNTDAASHLTFGDLRRAERLYDKHKGPQS